MKAFLDKDLAGENIVRDCMQDEIIKGFMDKMLYDEVIPTLPLDKQDLLKFAAAVSDRFNNPFVNHELASGMPDHVPGCVHCILQQ